MSSSLEVVTLGEPMVLLLAAADVPLAQAQRFDLSIAGAESNLAIGLARLGHRVAYAGRVGDDAFGHRIRHDLRAEGIDVGHLVTDPDRPTGLLIRDSPLARPITVLYRRSGSAASALTPSDVPVELIRGSRLLHVTGITAALSDTAFEAAQLAMTTARQHGVTVSFDPNVRLRLADRAHWREITDQLAQHADIVLTGADEAQLIDPDTRPERWYGDRGARIVVVKDGARGACEFDLVGGTKTSAPASMVPVVDPVGAGDAFNAGWLSAWLRDLPAVTRMQEATAVAGLVVATRGDCTGLPDVATRDRVVANVRDVER